MTAAMERFATAEVPPHKRLRFWNKLASEIYDGLYVNSPNEAFSAEMWRWKVGDLAMLRPRSEASTVGRRQSRPPAEERVMLNFLRRGRCHHLQLGREAELEAGDFTLCSASQPYELKLSSGHEMLAVEFPRAGLAARLPDLSARYMRRVPGGTASSRILHDFLLSLWLQGDLGGADPAWQEGVVNVFVDLLALAVRGSGGIAEQPGNHLRDRILALIEARLGDPELRTTDIAAELGVSVRTVQNVFAGLGTTPTAFILLRRLRRAAERLESNPGQSVTAVAFDLGFNDSAYFARCFRRQFGASPSAWRARR